MRKKLTYRKWLKHIVVFVFLPHFLLFAQTNPSDSGLKQIESVKKFVHEHPQEAIRIGKEYLNQSNKSDWQSRVTLYSLLSIAHTNLSLINEAQLLLDSAEVYSNTATSYNRIELVRAKVALLKKSEKEKEVINTIDNAISNAKKIEDDTLLVNLLLLKGDFFRSARQFDNALIYQQQALKTGLRTANSGLISDCNINIGSTYFQSSQFELARTWYLKAKDISLQNGDTISLISAYRNISLVDRDLGLLDEANQNLDIALKLAYAKDSPELIADILNLLGSLNVRLGKANEAIEYYKQSLAIRAEIGYLLSVASTLENLSRVQKDLNQFETATENLNRVISISEELNDNRNLGSAYNEMGNLYAQQGELADALKYYLLSLKIRQEGSSQSDIARSLTNIGLTYRRLGSHKNALKYFDQALELIPEETDPLGKAYTYILHGNTLRNLNRTTDALNSYQIALKLRKRTGNQLTVSQALRSIGNTYAEIENYPEANKYLNQALSILKDINDEKSIADTYNELGNLLLKENKLNQALEYFQYAATLFNKYNEIEKRGLCIRKIGEIQTKLGQFSYALESLQTALYIATETNNSKLKELTMLALHDFHVARGEFKEALAFFNRHIIIRDSLNALTQKEVIWQASLDLELDKKAQEIKLIEKEVEYLRAEAQIKTIQLEQQVLIRNFVVVVLLFVLIIALGSIWGYVIIRKKNVWLNEINNRLTKSENELRRLVQTKDKLFSIIAHDLRSPFTALVGLTEVLSKSAKEMTPTEVAEYGSVINESSQKLLDLIDNLLSWSRSQTGKIKLVTQNISIDKIAKEIASVLQLQASAKGIKIVVDIDSDLTIFADYDTISTVLRNLTSNAIKYTEKDGIIKLTAEKQNGDVKIYVTDNGVGISANNINKLFKIEDSFSTKGTSQEAGTGLGLIICKEFVEKNGGEIAVNSIVGEGTTFTITIPSHN
jgi:signal transduction histidine kinase/predicted negative regulator of RcsB-dependent stress response